MSLSHKICIELTKHRNHSSAVKTRQITTRATEEPYSTNFVYKCLKYQCVPNSKHCVY